MREDHQHQPIPESNSIFIAMGIVIVLGAILLAWAAFAHDDGRYANSKLKPWFDSLRNRDKGYCCSEADGRETEYDLRPASSGQGSSYWVPVDGVWREVPDHALIDGPNKFGRPLVWIDAARNIRCFIPGSGL